MTKDFFTEHYPQIDQLYNDYINSNEYMNHPIVQYVEPLTNDVINESFEYLKQGKEIRANDTLVSCAIIHEQSGFTLGFSLAMKLISESISAEFSRKVVK